MHKAEEVRDVAAIAGTGLTYKEIEPMLLSYAALLEAMEKMLAEEPVEMALVVNEVKRVAAEIAARRKV